MVTLREFPLKMHCLGLVSYVLGFKLTGDGHQPNSST